MLYVAHQHITQSVHIIAYTGWHRTNAQICVLGRLQDILPHDVPIISVSKGLEVGTGKMMSELVVDVLGRKHPCVFMSGPSFAKEVMTLQPTGVVAASKVSIQPVCITLHMSVTTLCSLQKAYQPVQHHGAAVCAASSMHISSTFTLLHV